MKKRKIITLLFFLVILTVLTIYFCNRLVSETAKGKIYSDINTIPYNKVGVLLGTSKYLKRGVINPYYAYRIEATVDLIKAAKIKYVIISGDNGHSEYNEPEMMRNDLVRAGVDSAAIILDYAGFRTFDSMIRAKVIFGQNYVTVISQQFHNERAIFTGSKLGMNAIGFNAKDVSAAQGIKVKAREKLARVKVVLDLIFGKKAKFLGNRIVIPS